MLAVQLASQRRVEREVKHLNQDLAILQIGRGGGGRGFGVEGLPGDDLVLGPLDEVDGEVLARHDAGSLGFRY